MQKNKRTMGEILSSSRLLSGISSECNAKLAQSARVRKYRSGDPIALQGDVSSSMYMICSGCVKVYRTTDRGVDVVLGLLGPDDSFGELSAVDNLPRMVSMTAIQDTDVVEISSEALHDAVMTSPGLAWALLRELSLKLRLQISCFETLATKDVAARVADLLLRLSRDHSAPLVTTQQCANQPPQPGATVISVSLSQGDIATFVGATSERVGHVMREMRANHLIGRDDDTKRIVVMDHAKLKQLAESD